LNIVIGEGEKIVQFFKLMWWRNGWSCKWGWPCCWG